MAPRARWLVPLGALVLLAHLWLANEALPPQLGEGSAPTGRTRIDVAFVQDLAQATPPGAPAAAPAAVRAQPARQAAAPAPAASAPDVQVAQAEPDTMPAAAPEPPASAPIAAEPVANASTVASATPTEPSAPASASASASASAAASTTAATAATDAAFDWPPSTRLTYTLHGNYRGQVEGQAQVEWLRSGNRYQVFMDLSIGPSFAPLMSRRVSSEGDITPQGLHPQRYDEETKALLRTTRHATILLDADRVRLANGTELPRPAGVQDSASQFVHLTWLFTTQPHMLQAGRSIEMPLALPRRVQPWIYDVLGTETLVTPAGNVQAVHVKPRREPKPGVDLTAEMWVAPSLQYLPVRILIRQDAETYIDMLIERLPQQATTVPTPVKTPVQTPVQTPVPSPTNAGNGPVLINPQLPK